MFTKCLGSSEAKFVVDHIFNGCWGSILPPIVCIVCLNENFLASELLVVARHLYDLVVVLAEALLSSS